MEVQDKCRTIAAQLDDPSRSSQALMMLLAVGRDSVPALVEFLRSTRPSSMPEGRLMAVEGLSILKGPAALAALILVATQDLAHIDDPVVRFAEETVASRAALALADFSEPHAYDALLELLHEKPLVGVAEAFEKLKEARAIPYLISWLEEDFVAEAAGRAILAFGPAAIPALLDSLQQTRSRHGDEIGASRRRRARILAILSELAAPESIDGLEDLLDNPDEGIRSKAVELFLNKGWPVRRREAFRAAFNLLQSSDGFVRAEVERLLTANSDLGIDLVDEEIAKRRRKGEAEDFWPRETALAILLRIQRKSKRGGEI
jgi:HEAT repeat protein